MKFSLSAVVLTLATSVVALPGFGPQAGGVGAGNGVGNVDNGNIRFPVKKSVTVQEAQTKCGDQATLSCCNKATYAGNTVTADSGLLGGALSSLVGGGSGSDGLGLFDQCSKLPIDVSVIGVGVNDLVNQQCKQNIACCQNSPSSATGLVGVGLPCVALGSII